MPFLFLFESDGRPRQIDYILLSDHLQCSWNSLVEWCQIKGKTKTDHIPLKCTVQIQATKKKKKRTRWHCTNWVPRIEKEFQQRCAENTLYEAKEIDNFSEICFRGGEKFEENCAKGGR